MASDRSSFAWALHLEASETPLTQLSESELLGLEYAQALADDHKRCSAEPPWRRDIPPLTIEEIASDAGLAPAVVRALTQGARRAFFGDLGDAAIAKRVQRQRARSERPCAQPGCPETLPIAAASNRHYCRHHGSGPERVERYRQQRRSSGEVSG